MNMILQNHSLAGRIKEDRQKRMAAVMRNAYQKQNLGDTMRSENRRLTELRG